MKSIINFTFSKNAFQHIQHVLRKKFCLNRRDRRTLRELGGEGFVGFFDGLWLLFFKSALIKNVTPG